MKAFVGVALVSLGCLAFLGGVGVFCAWAERKAYRHRRKGLDQAWHKNCTPFWYGDPPDGDTFP